MTLDQLGRITGHEDVVEPGAEERRVDGCPRAWRIRESGSDEQLGRPDAAGPDGQIRRQLPTGRERNRIARHAGHALARVDVHRQAPYVTPDRLVDRCWPLRKETLARFDEVDLHSRVFSKSPQHLPQCLDALETTPDDHDGKRSRC